MKFIYGNKYVYYKIYNNKGIFYHGIIDVTLNKVVFNTDEEIKEFKSYSNSSMLAITKDSAYKICILRDGGICLEDCPNNNQLFDSSSYNHCGSKWNAKFILKPNDICVDKCNQRIYIIKNYNESWLCKDLDDNFKYKLVNYSGCHQYILESSYFIKKELYIMGCKEGFKEIWKFWPQKKVSN